jgi:hypothetical protein
MAAPDRKIWAWQGKRDGEAGRRCPGDNGGSVMVANRPD